MPFVDLRRLVLIDAAAHELAVCRDSADEVTVGTAYGDLSFRSGPTDVRISINAPRPDFLYTLKESLLRQIGATWPEQTRNLRWSDGTPSSGLPPNVRLMTLAGVERLSRDFLRVLLMGDVSGFTDEAIHFRLGLPPEGRPPEWPQLAENGGTIWPKGEAALHLPAYTIRHADPNLGLSFDLFEHEGGRAAEWARTASPGTEVAVIGPGGGGCQVDGPLLGFADETALPAIARLIEAGSRGEVTLLASGGAVCGYPLPPSPHCRVRWLDRSAGTASLKDHALEGLEAAPPDTFLWFAGEQSAARAVRQAFKASGRPRDACYISAYWS